MKIYLRAHSFIAQITLALSLVQIMSPCSAQHIIDPPAADTNETAFFLKAAEYRPASSALTANTGRTLEHAAKFLMSDTGIDNNAIRDEQGNKIPPYINHAVIDDDNHFGYRSSFPAFHHAYLIEAFLNYYNYSGDREALRRARELADWTIAHSTPSDWKWPYLPWSTFTEGKPGGYEDRDSLQPDKAGYMGLSYTRLYEVTGSRKYLDSVREIADTLTARQSGDGSWPFRVNPKTGEVSQQYTAAIFFNVAFLEKAFSLIHNYNYKNSQILAWMWMMRNPLRTDNWSGLYEDIPRESNSQVHYSPLQTIRLLLRYRNEVNGKSYLEHAKRLYDYTMDGLSFVDRDMGLLFREQTGYMAATPSSTLNWSMMSGEFYLTTGEERYRATVLEAVRMVDKYGLKPDGRAHNTVLSPNSYGDYGCWYSLTSPVVRYLYQDMGCLPEIAPEGETHLLRCSTQVQAISYQKQKLNYRTLSDSVELIKVARPPIKVLAAGVELKQAAKLNAPSCYLYNGKSHVLLVRHTNPQISVVFTAVGSK